MNIVVLQRNSCVHVSGRMNVYRCVCCQHPRQVNEQTLTITGNGSKKYGVASVQKTNYRMNAKRIARRTVTAGNMVANRRRSHNRNEVREQDNVEWRRRYYGLDGAYTTPRPSRRCDYSPSRHHGVWQAPCRQCKRHRCNPSMRKEGKPEIVPPAVSQSNGHASSMSSVSHASMA